MSTFSDEKMFILTPLCNCNWFSYGDVGTIGDDEPETQAPFGERRPDDIRTAAEGQFLQFPGGEERAAPQQDVQLFGEPLQPALVLLHEQPGGALREGREDVRLRGVRGELRGRQRGAGGGSGRGEGLQEDSARDLEAVADEHRAAEQQVQLFGADGLHGQHRVSSETARQSCRSGRWAGNSYKR